MEDKKKSKKEMSAEVKKLKDLLKQKQIELEQLIKTLDEDDTSIRTERVINRELHSEIEQRRILEKALEKSEARFRRLFETAQDGVIILDFDTERIDEVNPFLADLLGQPCEFFTGKKLWELGAFKDVELCRNAFKELKSNEYIRYDNLPLQAKDGKMVEAEFICNVYLVGRRKVIQCNVRIPRK